MGSFVEGQDKVKKFRVKMAYPNAQLRGITGKKLGGGWFESDEPVESKKKHRVAKEFLEEMSDNENMAM